jgi:hypothetical protein
MDNVGRGGDFGIVMIFSFENLGMNVLWSEIFNLSHGEEGVGDVGVCLRKLGEDHSSEHVIINFDAIEGVVRAKTPENIKLSLKCAIVNKAGGDVFSPVEDDRDRILLLVLELEPGDLFCGGINHGGCALHAGWHEHWLALEFSGNVIRDSSADKTVSLHLSLIGSVLG